MTCTVSGCDGKVKAKGLCPKHYQQQRRGTLDTSRVSHETKPIAPGDGPDTKTDKNTILDRIFGGRVIKTPGETMPKEPNADGGKKDTKPKPKPKPTPTNRSGHPRVSPALFLMIGHRLDKTFETKDFGLDREEAEYMAELMADAMAEKGKEVSPTGMLVVAIVMWIIPPLLTHLPKKLGMGEHSDEHPSDGDKVGLRRNKEGFLSRIKNRFKRKNPETQRQPLPSPPQPTEPITETGVPMNTFEPRKVNKDWKPVDLTGMEQKSTRFHETRKPTKAK